MKEPNDFINIIRKGVELGMTLIDTAEVYDNGLSEELVGKGIRNIRKKCLS